MSATTLGSSRREGDDDYCRIIIALNERYRIIICRDGIQWIIQKRVSAQTATKAQWRGLKYHRSREGLIAALVGLQIKFSADQLATLNSLPEWITEP